MQTELRIFIDPPLFLALLVLIACAISGSSIWYFCRPQRGPGFWCTCCWLLLASYSIYMLQGEHSPLWLTWLRNALLIQAQAVLMLGILRFLHQAPPLWLIPLCGGVQLGADVATAYGGLTPAAHDAAYCLIVMFTALFVCIRMRTDHVYAQVRAVSLYIVFSLSAFSLVHLLRMATGVYCALQGDPAGLFQPDSVIVWSLYTGLPFLVIALVALTAMSLHRTSAQSLAHAEQARASLLRFEQLMRISSAAMLLLRHGRIEDSNAKLSEMFGASRDMLQGLDFERLFHAEGPTEEPFGPFTPVMLHRVAKRADDSYFHVEVILLSLGENQCLAEIRDVTRQKTMEAKLTHLASVDPLTGALNRRAFAERYEQARHKATTLCLAMLDLDHFKQINDLYGHTAGDEVLATLSRLGQAQLRRGDLFARFGGEEFVMVLLDTTQEEATVYLAQLRAALAAATLPGIPDSVTISFSAGLVADTTAGSLESVLQRADQALYEAKKNGRNRVEIALSG